MIKVYAIVLNYNGEKDTNECIKSLEKSIQKSFELSIVVVDNASEKPFKPLNKNIILLKNTVNKGFSGGNNTGIRFALENNADYVLILNNDTLVDPHIIEELLVGANSDSQVGIVSPKIYFAKGYEYHKDRYKPEELGKVIWYAGGEMDWKNLIGHHTGVDEVDTGQYDKTTEIEYSSGCCMLVKKEVFEKIGYFDENYFLYYEDNDLSIRAKNFGFKIMYVPKAIVWHKNAGSVGGSGSELQDYYITRNRLLFGIRYAPLRTKIALIKESISFYLNGRKWQKKGVSDFYQRKFWKGSFTI